MVHMRQSLKTCAPGVIRRSNPSMSCLQPPSEMLPPKQNACMHESRHLNFLLTDASVSSHKNEQSHHPGASAPGFFHIPPIRLTDNRQGSQPISGNKATPTIPATEPDDNSDSSGCPSRSHRRKPPRGSAPRGEGIKEEAVDFQRLPLWW